MTLITYKIYRYTTKNIKIIFDDPNLDASRSYSQLIGIW